MLLSDSFWDPRGENEMRKQREMEYHWGLKEGSAHLRQGWLRVCVCVCVSTPKVLHCGKEKGSIFA